MAVWFGLLTKLAVALLFFMHGAKLSRQNCWRASATGVPVVVMATFVLFPLLGLLLTPWCLMAEPGHLPRFPLPVPLPPPCSQPSPSPPWPAAMRRRRCAAPRPPSILGIFLSPVLVGLMIGVRGGSIPGTHSQAIMVQLMLPFVVGHLSRPLIGRWVDSHRPLIGKLDQSSILLVVYVAFSGRWCRDLAPGRLVRSGQHGVLLSCVLLALVLGWNVWISRRLPVLARRTDHHRLLRLQKSLASGAPLANVMFPAASVGVMVLPLMIFHQIQLMVCAVLARRYRERSGASGCKQG